jgi:hypothetical protein
VSSSRVSEGTWRLHLQGQAVPKRPIKQHHQHAQLQSLPFLIFLTAHSKARLISSDSKVCLYISVYHLQSLHYRRPFTIFTLPYTFYNLYITVYRLQSLHYRIPFTIFTLPYTTYNLYITVYHLQSLHYRIPFTIFTLPYTIYNLYITVYHLQSLHYRIPFFVVLYNHMLQ